jgi:hypothetical protein
MYTRKNIMKRYLGLLMGSMIIITLFLFSSCAMQQGLSLTRNRSGWATTDLYVYDFFLTVLEDFEPFTEEEEEISMMDASVEDFVENLHQSPSASDVSLMHVGTNGYFIDFTFSSLEDLLADLNRKEPQTIARVRETHQSTTLTFYLDIENYPQLMRMVPFLADPNFETFGPLYNEGMSEEEYLDMISYILGEEGPDAIKNSVISLRLTTPSVITNYRGGVKESPNSIRFDIPLIDFLLLAEPIAFSASW